MALDRRNFLAMAGMLFPASTALSTPRNVKTETRQSESDHAVWKSYYDERRVWGYTDRHSITPGESFNVMLSTGPSLETIRGVIEVFRIGSYHDGDRKLVWRSAPIRIERQEVEATAATVGANWPPAIDDVETAKWRTGYYTIDFVVEGDDRDINVAYIVVTNAKRSGDVLVVLSTNTYQAYNAWGGHSFYESDFIGNRGQMISFDRPHSPAFFEYEYYLVTWLERLAETNNFTIDYATNFDVHRERVFAEKYPLLISSSHNEYWSKEEFDAVYDRIFKLGKNTLFLGANAAYWQIRYADVNRAKGSEDWGRQLICYKSPDDPIRQRVGDDQGDLLVTLRFRDGSRRPETMLMGAAYQSYFDPRSDTDPKFAYYVAQTNMPFFYGTGYVKGESIGDVLGYEWDNTDPEEDGHRLWDAQKSRIPQIEPGSTIVLFTGNPVDVNGKQSKAEATYFRSSAGADVFCVGSTRWAWGLGKPSFEREKFKIFNRNLILYFLGRR